SVDSDISLAKDLEPGLLNDLQASFSSVFSALPLPASAPAPSAPPVKAAAPALKSATVAPQPKTEPIAPATTVPFAPLMAAAPVAHTEKPADRPERPAIAVAQRSKKP